MLARLLALVALLSTSAAPALAYDPSKAGRYGGLDLDRLDAGKVILQGPGSTGDGSGFCVRLGAGFPCLDLSVPRNAIPVSAYGVVGDGSDETAKASAAVIDATAKGRPLWFLPGKTYRVQSILVAVDNAHIIVDGTLKLTDGGKGQGVINVSSEGLANPINHVLLEGRGTIDGNRDAAGPDAIACINAFRVTNFVARGLTATNCQYFPINVWNDSENITLSDMTLSYSGNAAQCAAGVKNCRATRLHIHHIKDYGWSFYSAVDGGSLTDSYIHHNMAGGVAVLADGVVGALTGRASSNITISGNEFAYNYAAGIHVQSDCPKDVTPCPPLAQHNNISIVNNKIHHNHQWIEIEAGFGGVFVRNAKNLVISDNQSYDNGLPGSGRASVGYWLASDVSVVSITGNTSLREGIGGSGGIGILIDAAATDVTVANNIIRDDQASPTMVFGLSGQFGNNTRGSVTGNQISGMRVGSDNLSYGNDTIRDPVWRPCAPTFTTSTGSLGAQPTVLSCSYAYDGRTMQINAQFTISNPGNAGGVLWMSTPEGLAPFSRVGGATGFEYQALGVPLRVSSDPGDTRLTITRLDGTTAIGTNYGYTVSTNFRVR